MYYMQRNLLAFIVCGLALTTFTGCIQQETPKETVVEAVLPLNTLEEDLDAALVAGIDALEVEGDALIQKNDLETKLDAVVNSNIYYPMVHYTDLRTKKVFAQLISPDSEDRFSGYHTGDDIEVTDVTNDAVPVYAMASGEIVRKQWVAGYGGVVVIEFEERDNNNNISTYHALYGHLNLESIKYSEGDTVLAGNQLGVLGAHESEETDGEREHLHFGVYEYTGTIRFAGYVDNEADLIYWENPSEFMRQRFVNELPQEAIIDDLNAAVENIVNETP